MKRDSFSYEMAVSRINAKQNADLCTTAFSYRDNVQLLCKNYYSYQKTIALVLQDSWYTIPIQVIHPFHDIGTKRIFVSLLQNCFSVNTKKQLL